MIQKYAISKPHINYINFIQKTILFNIGELSLNDNEFEQFKQQLANDKEVIIIWSKDQ